MRIKEWIKKNCKECGTEFEVTPTHSYKVFCTPLCRKEHNKKGKRHSKVSSTYRSWSHMKSRCLNPNIDNFQNYGGRGIKVCERWMESFDNFLQDMGERPDGMTLDRLNTNENYEPSNCKWSTDAEQRRNKRNRRTSWRSVFSK